MMTNHRVCQDITGGGGWSPVLSLLQSSERAARVISMTSEEDKYVCVCVCGRAAGYLGWGVGGGRWRWGNQGTGFSTYPEENA